MEADWAVEIGADLPAIIVPWEGFIDLRQGPSLARQLSEGIASPILAQSLIKLNQDNSPVFSSKCDLWRLSADEIDPLEFDADREDARKGIACYIDIIARNSALFCSFAAHEAWVRSAVTEIQRAELSRCRVDLVVRSSTVEDRNGYALTLYAASCGSTEDAAGNTFRAVLENAVTITMKLAATTGE